MSRRAVYAVLLVVCSGLGAAAASEKKIFPAQYGERWPFTVEEGILACDASKRPRLGVTFQAAGRIYAVNGAAKSAGVPPMDPIWCLKPGGLGLVVKPVTRIPESDRRRIFAGMWRVKTTRRKRTHVQGHTSKETAPNQGRVSMRFATRA